VPDLVLEVRRQVFQSVDALVDVGKRKQVQQNVDWRQAQSNTPLPMK
jgi:hypothetical protein